MQVLPTPHPTSAPEVTAHRVAAVARDVLTLRRVCDAAEAGGLEVVGAACDVASLSQLASEADTIVLAGATSVADRKALIRETSARFPSVPLVMVASGPSNSLHKAVEAGACGIVYDADVETALAATARAVAVGQVVVPRGLRRHATRPALSHREKQTLALVVMGLTNRQIAARLFLAESTVKTHLTSIFGKLGVGSRSEAVALVLDPEQHLGLGILGLSQGAPVMPVAAAQEAS